MFIFQNPLPRGLSNNIPASCSPVAGSVICSDSLLLFDDGIHGDETDSLVVSDFYTWNASSTLSFQVGGFTVRQMNLFFYHEPSAGIGLPDFKFSVSDSALPGNPLPYTILDNQDLKEDDATVRNVTFAFPDPMADVQFQIEFSMTENIKEFAISELQLCTDEGICIMKIYIFVFYACFFNHSSQHCRRDSFP